MDSNIFMTSLNYVVLNHSSLLSSQLELIRQNKQQTYVYNSVCTVEEIAFSTTITANKYIQIRRKR